MISSHTERHASACRFVLIAGHATPPSPGAGGSGWSARRTHGGEILTLRWKSEPFSQLMLEFSHVTLETFFAVTLQKHNRDLFSRLPCKPQLFSRL
jgi:hypothetical protein